MYKYLLGKHPKKSPGLPFFKVKMICDRKTNIGKKMNKSEIELSKDTELLVLGNNYLSQKIKKKNNKKITIIRQNPQERKLSAILNNEPNKENKTQHYINKTKKVHYTLAQKFLIQAKKEFLTQKLEKIKAKEKNNNMKKIMKVSSLNINSNKTNNIVTKKYQNNNTNRRNESSTQRTNYTNILNKTFKNEKHLFERLFFNKKMKNNTYRNIKNLSNILKDTTKSSIMLNMDIKNYSQDNSFKNLGKIILDKTLKQSKSQDDIKAEADRDFRKLFDKRLHFLNRPLKQIKVRENKKNKMIWVKKSTANLISFGQVSQSINDVQFYKERKRIIENYRIYEREADIRIARRKSEKQNYRSEVGYQNLKKIDELLAQNTQLIKDILEKDNKK